MSIRSRKYELIITEPAEIDLESISALINKDPSIGKKRYGLPGVILGRKSGRHVIFYRVQDNTIYIIRILHETMDHGRHIN
jgi:toxin ParE1/3/4